MRSYKYPRFQSQPRTIFPKQPFFHRMKRLAFVDHSFHERTGSSAFFRDLLRSRFEVESFPDDSWRTGRLDPALAGALVNGEFEAFVFWQALWPLDLLGALGIGPPLFVPMFDDVASRDSLWWRSYRGGRFISFSRRLDRILRDAGASDVLPVRYAPPLPEAPGNPEEDTAFFWQRGREIGWKTVRQLSGGHQWSRFHLHWAPDPGQGRMSPPSPGAENPNLLVTRWFETKSEYEAAAASCLVYFAPRQFEGIGMGFLEAMARGQCVVAPAAPTHDEYLRHGENGLLYDPQTASSLDFGRARELGKAARASMEVAREEWLRTVPAVLDFVEAGVRPCDRAKGEAFLRDNGGRDQVWRTDPGLFRRMVRRIRRSVFQVR